MTPHRSLSYQPHIDGLRTIAILPVLLFHAELAGVGGGYVGVDVFFVISGFLITSILRHEIGSGTFSFARFYERRIRRLIPAQVPVLLFSLAFATLFFVGTDFVDFINSMFFSTIFSANWYFLATSGYFDAPADVKLLLHNWSLSVEEQYYFLFPFVLIFARRFSVKGGLIAICLIAVASFAYAQSLVASGQSEIAFLHSGARFWELMIGSLLTFVPNPPARFRTGVAALRLIGLAMVMSAIIVFTKDTPFPGLAAVLPTIGTALIIYGGTMESASWWREPVGALLSTRLFVYIGKISYSLYLWHWPLLVAVNYLYQDPGSSLRVAALVAAVVLSAASHRWIEEPFRKKRMLPTRRRAFAGFAAVSATAVGVFALVQITDGLPQRFSPELRAALERSKVVWAPNCRKVKFEADDISGCLIGTDIVPEPEQVQMIVWGDSLAATIGDIVQEYAVETGETVLLFSNPSCPSLINTRKDRDLKGDCPAINDRIMAFAERSGAQIVLVSAWRDLASDRKGPFGVVDTAGEHVVGEALDVQLRGAFDAMLSRFGDRPVLVVGQPPRYKFEVDSVVARDAILGRAPTPVNDISAYSEGEARVETLFSVNRPATAYIEAVTPFCDAQACDYADGLVALFNDPVHINSAGAQRLQPSILSALKSAGAGNQKVVSQAPQ